MGRHQTGYNPEASKYADIIRERYPVVPNAKQFASEIGLAYGTLLTYARLLGVRREKGPLSETRAAIDELRPVLRRAIDDHIARRDALAKTSTANPNYPARFHASCQAERRVVTLLKGWGRLTGRDRGMFHHEGLWCLDVVGDLVRR